ncbi:hypothetical protein HY439_01770 [Candidatus Microgenomates bacterium]|nr:hypothetical protein [Candidatus Microgenomates bacterium]
MGEKEHRNGLNLSADSEKILSATLHRAEALGQITFSTPDLLFQLSYHPTIIRFLSGLNIDPDHLRFVLENGSSSSKGKNGQRLRNGVVVVPSGAVKRAIEIAKFEAQRSGSTTVEPHHLLGGLIMERTGAASKTLKAMGVEREKMAQNDQLLAPSI